MSINYYKSQKHKAKHKKERLRYYQSEFLSKKSEYQHFISCEKRALTPSGPFEGPLRRKYDNKMSQLKKQEKMYERDGFDNVLSDIKRVINQLLEDIEYFSRKIEHLLSQLND